LSYTTIVWLITQPEAMARV